MMKTYGFYSIRSNVVKEILEKIIIYITSSFVEAMAINVIGSSVNRIVSTNSIPSSDIDIAILINGSIDYSKTNINLNGIDTYLMNNNIQVNISYNGIRRISKENAMLSIDLILQSYEELLNKEPHVVFDVAKRNRVLLFGEDYYKSIENTEMTYDLLLERINMTRNYISREINNYDNDRIDWVRYIAKSAILNTSYIFINSYNTVSKKDIYEYCKRNYPALSLDIEYLYNIYLGNKKVDIEQIFQFNIEYGDKLLKVYKL